MSPFEVMPVPLWRRCRAQTLHGASGAVDKLDPFRLSPPAEQSFRCSIESAIKDAQEMEEARLAIEHAAKQLVVERRRCGDGVGGGRCRSDHRLEALKQALQDGQMLASRADRKRARQLECLARAPPEVLRRSCEAHGLLES